MRGVKIDHAGCRTRSANVEPKAGCVDTMGYALRYASRHTPE
jgi:hypothetical protein